MSDARQFFPGVHALRAIAATLVVIQHAGFAAKDYFVFGYDIDNDYFVWGRVGVILFFAISGFVIALQRTRPVGIFIVHRFLRIYPSYWLAMALAAAATAIVAQPVAAGLSSILLYPSTGSDTTLWIPYWTLVYEVVFYALAAVAFSMRLSDRALTVLALLWILAVNLFAGNPTDTEYAFPGRSILLSAAVQVFPLGLICGIHFERFKRPGRWPYLLACVVAFAAAIPLAELTVSKILMHGISSCFLILATADLNIRSRIVELLGNASYGIYLMHFPAMMFAAAVSPSHAFFWFFAIGVTSGILFGLFDHQLYRKMLGLVRPGSAGTSGR